MTRVPYRGSAPIINDLIGGHLPFGITTIADAALRHMRGKVGANASLSAALQVSGMLWPLYVSAAFRAFGRGIVWGERRRFPSN
jgi:hypothetical protein